MADSLFMKVEEVADELGISVSYAYKLVHSLNQELQQMGYITLSGRIDRKYFHEKIYGTSTERGKMDGSL